MTSDESLDFKATSISFKCSLLMNLKNEVEAEVPEICIPCDSQQRKTPAVVEGKMSLSFLNLSPQ